MSQGKSHVAELDGLRFPAVKTPSHAVLGENLQNVSLKQQNALDLAKPSLSGVAKAQALEVGLPMKERAEVADVPMDRARDAVPVEDQSIDHPTDWNDELSDQLGEVDQDVSSDFSFRKGKDTCERDNPIKLMKRRGICYSCRQPGHWARDCVIEHSGQYRMNNKPSWKKDHNRRPNSVRDGPSSCLAFSGSNENKIEVTWISDSGTTNHLTSIRELWVRIPGNTETSFYSKQGKSQSSCHNSGGNGPPSSSSRRGRTDIYLREDSSRKVIKEKGSGEITPEENSSREVAKRKVPPLLVIPAGSAFATPQGKRMPDDELPRTKKDVRKVVEKDSRKSSPKDHSSRKVKNDRKEKEKSEEPFQKGPKLSESSNSDADSTGSPKK